VVSSPEYISIVLADWFLECGDDVQVCGLSGERKRERMCTAAILHVGTFGVLTLATID
jgi:hypothetical protein